MRPEERTMKTKKSRPSRYDDMLRKVSRIADQHPRSYVIVDARTYELIESGVDAKKVFSAAKKKLKPGQIPIIYKKQQKGEILIFDFRCF